MASSVRGRTFADAGRVATSVVGLTGIEAGKSVMFAGRPDGRCGIGSALERGGCCPFPSLSLVMLTPLWL